MRDACEKVNSIRFETIKRRSTTTLKEISFPKLYRSALVADRVILNPGLQLNETQFSVVNGLFQFSTYLQVIQEDLQPPIANRAASERQRADLSLRQRESVGQFRDILVGGPQKNQRMKSSLEQRGVQTGSRAWRHGTEFTTPQHWYQTCPESGSRVKYVPPS